MRLSIGTAPAGAVVHAHHAGGGAPTLGAPVATAVADQWGGVLFPQLELGVQYIAALEDGRRLCYFRERSRWERGGNLRPGWPMA